MAHLASSGTAGTASTTDETMHLDIHVQGCAIDPAEDSRHAATSAPVHTYPETTPDWNNLKVLHRSTLPPRAHFYQYAREADAVSHDAARSQSLRLTGGADGGGAGGEWKLHVSASPLTGPRDFHAPGFRADAASGWKSVAVPGMWQLQGLGRGPQYTNVNFPWPVDPPHVLLDDNECGRYLTTFRVPKSLPYGSSDGGAGFATSTPGTQLRLRFEGVDSAFAVWLNGRYVGYSQGARNPSEFDVTELVRVADGAEADGENTLAVEVYQRCDGSYLEDQDQWWLSGIFRDVVLHAFPPVAIEDFQVKTLLDDDYRDAQLVVDVRVRDERDESRSTAHHGPPSLRLKLVDADGRIVADDEKPVSLFCARKGTLRTWRAHVSLPVANPHKWTAETPYLYSLVLSLKGGGEPSAFLSQKVGFRRTELIDGVFCVNGQPVKIRGVNRHEHHPDSGRAVPFAWLRHDLQLMKLHNINAIRTSHYINDPRLYELANELGFWVLDEADLECHGFGELGGPAAPNSWTSDNPDWESAYTDRAHHMVARDKNQPCVVIWSLGNESFYGRNHQAMYDLIKAHDDTRLIHYEPDQDAKTVDMFSRMYASPSEVIRMGQEETWRKPLVLCEYAHAMGNGPGAIKEYVDAFYAYPRLMGGFVWEWANHGLRTRNKEGESYMAYGGDFGDEPNDGHFVMDGLCFSNHSPTPGLIEYKKAIEPVQTLSIKGNQITIVNRYDFLTLDHLQCTWHVVYDGWVTEKRPVAIPKGIKPHSKATIAVDGLQQPPTGAAYLTLSFTLRQATTWAPAGHEVAFHQLQLGKPSGLRRWQTLTVPDYLRRQPLAKLLTPSQLLIQGADSAEWVFDLAMGSITSWTRNKAYPGVNLITEPLSLELYRALTDNDSGGVFGPQWQKHRLHQAKTHVVRASWTVREDSGVAEVTVVSRVAAPVLSWSVAAETTYRFSGRSVAIHVRAKPQGANLPPTIARFGLQLGLAGVDTVRWFGRGPGESYRDKKLSQRFGNWESRVDRLFVDYEYPQDNGNRTDVRWVEFLGPKNGGSGSNSGGSSSSSSGRRLLRARFDDETNASFQALAYTTADLDAAKHPYELKKLKRDDTIVHLDWAHHGLGTGSCGPSTLPHYQLRTDQEFDVEILLD